MVLMQAAVGLFVVSAVAVALCAYRKREQERLERQQRENTALLRRSNNNRRFPPDSAVAQLRALPRLVNEYYAMRHGESMANVQGLVSSHNVLSRKQHGLSAQGRKDAADGAAKLKVFFEATKTDQRKDVFIIHSPFLRTSETADIVAKTLDADAIVAEDMLCERSFGIFEGQPSHSSYDQVWAQDTINGCETNPFECESVYSVSERAAKVLLKCEKMSPDGGCRFVIVSHGDILQIMRTVLQRDTDPKWHRQGDHLHPGQVIRLDIE